MLIGNFNSEELYKAQVYLFDKKTGKTQTRTIRIINS